MTLVNPGLIQLAQVKDSRWLTLEVCREFQRNKCSRTENECKFAHPPPHVEVQNGRVICCYDSIKGKCQRKEPPCKYLHPPQHLREQLLQNGRNNLIMKNIQMQLLSQSFAASGQLIPISTSYMNGTMPGAQTPPSAAYNPFISPGGLPMMTTTADAIMASQQQQQQMPQVSLSNGMNGSSTPNGITPPLKMDRDSYPGMDLYSQHIAAAAAAAAKKRKLDSGAEEHFIPMGMSGMLPNGCNYSMGAAPGAKRPATADGKAGGIPLYQPSYQHLTTFQVPSPHSNGAYLHPTSCEYFLAPLS